MMKRFFTTLGMFSILSLLFIGTAAADASKDEKNLEREAKRLNETAAKPDGEQAVAKRLAAEFKATDKQVQELRTRNFSYGEAAIVLSLAQTQPGGVTDASVQKVLALRQGPPVRGWGEVARQLGAKLGKTVSLVRKAANNANRDIKNDHARTGKIPKQAPAEQKQPPQEAGKPSYQGEGRLLRHGGSAQ